VHKKNNEKEVSWEKDAELPCAPEIEIKMIHKCMAAPVPGAHLHDRSTAALGHHHIELGLDQHGWGTGCPAALPPSWSHCHTTGPPQNV